MSPDWLTTLVQTVQHNCHIADARHAGDYTLCIYLLKMREFYRWEQQLDLQQPIDSDAVGEWLIQRENLWNELDEQDYQALCLQQGELEPFANEAINAHLNPHGLVYSAGYGRRCRPLFFLGELEQTITQDDYTILLAGRELARDIEAPPAMNQGQLILIRREALRRFIWEKIEEWRWHPADSPIGRALTYYALDQDAAAALEAMTQTELATVMAHEIGEVKAGQLLDNTAWQTMLTTLPTSAAEIMLRAVRDHLADCLQTLPLLVQNANPAALHFYIGNLTAMRKKLAPQLLVRYQQWCDTGDFAPFEAYAHQGRAHWLQVGKQALVLFQQQSKQATSSIEAYIENNTL